MSLLKAVLLTGAMIGVVAIGGHVSGTSFFKDMVSDEPFPNASTSPGGSVRAKPAEYIPEARPEHEEWISNARKSEGRPSLEPSTENPGSGDTPGGN